MKPISQRPRRGDKFTGVSTKSRDGFLDGGSGERSFGPLGDQFDLILGITVKPFSHGGERAFDPARLLD